MTPCYRKYDPKKKRIWRCAGAGCTHTYASRSIRRVTRHGISYRRLTEDQRSLAAKNALAKAPSALATQAQEEARKEIKTKSRAGKGEVDGAAMPLILASAVVGVEPKIDVHKLSAAAGRKVRHTKADHEMTKLFCVGGLPRRLVDRPEWSSMLNALDASYAVPSRERLENEMIVGELVVVRAASLAHMQRYINNMVSTDGGTSTGREAFYTSCCSDPNGVVYLMEARECTDVSHTGVWIGQLNIEVIKRIGPKHIGGYICDSTGNTRVSRRVVSEEYATIIGLADACHHISNYIKNIVKITYFELCIEVVRGTIRYYHESHFGIADLKRARLEMNVTRGLESIGKTRFGTIIHSSRSVQRCIPAIQRTLDYGRVSFEYEEYFDRNSSRSAFEFTHTLQQLIDIGKPATNALTCLEAMDVNVSDVYIYWHSIIAHTVQLLLDPKKDYPQHVRKEVLAFLKYRFNQFFNETGDLYSPAYLAATYLNPNYLCCDLFKVEPQDSERAGIQHPTTFKHVAKYLNELVSAEIHAGYHAHYTRWRVGSEFRAQFKKELYLYARGQYPYNIPITNESAPHAVRQWWTDVCASDSCLPPQSQSACILPHIAIKLYSLRPNSMPEERTVSAFTWLTPPERSQMAVETMAGTVQIRQFHNAQAKIKRRTHLDHNFKAKFSDVEKAELDPNATLNDDKDDSWLDKSKPQDVEVDTKFVVPEKMWLTLFETPVNMRSSIVWEKLTTEDQMRSGQDASTQMADKEDNQMEVDPNDTNYSIDF